MSQYKSILKATSIFGGTQVLSMMVTIIRSKFVAILIGSTGMGLSTMYMSSLTMIITIFGLGIGTSVVRELSACHENHDEDRFSLIVSVYKRILMISALAGTICVIVMSPFLSEWAFKTKEHAIAFCFLSLIVLFTLLSSGNSALLVSMRRIKDTATCGIVGSIISLLTSIPLFYFYGIEGIVPGLIVSTFGNYVVTYLYARRLKIKTLRVSWHDVYVYGRPMVTLGVTMIIASLVGQLATYLINISISRLGGLSDIGLFNAAMGITLQVVGMVYAAMAADYYPRLAASMGNREKMSETINQQSEILLLLSVPILVVFVIVAPIVIKILLSDEFLVLTSFIRIVCLGMLLKTAAYALGYASFAKGDKKIYLFLEGGYSNVANLILSVSFYYFWGLVGLAWSFVVNYLLYYILISFVDIKRYDYFMSTDLKKLTLLSFLIMGVLVILDLSISGISYYCVSSVIAVVAVAYYLTLLNKKTGLLQIIKTKYFSK